MKTTKNKRKFTPTYKVKFEPTLIVTKGLSPRHHITSHEFKKIKKQRIEEIGGRWCELCGDTPESAGDLHLHESFHYEKNTYFFDGFYLLCVYCHKGIHGTYVSSYVDHLLADLNYSIVTGKKFDAHCYHYLEDANAFKSNKVAAKNLYDNLLAALNFALCSNPKANYDAAKKYVSPTKLLQGFNTMYSHEYGKLHLLAQKYFRERNVVCKFLKMQTYKKIKMPLNDYQKILLKPFSLNSPYFKFFFDILGSDLVAEFAKQQLSEEDIIYYGSPFYKQMFTHFKVKNPHYSDPEEFKRIVENRRKYKDLVDTTLPLINNRINTPTLREQSLKKSEHEAIRSRSVIP